MGLDVPWIASGSVVYTHKKTNPWPMEPAMLQNTSGLQSLLSSSNKKWKSIKNTDLQSKQKQRDSILGEAKSPTLWKSLFHTLVAPETSPLRFNVVSQKNKNRFTI